MHLEAMTRFHDRLLGPHWRSHHGHQALVDGFVAPLRPCAARAALREQARSYICFGPIMSVGLPRPPCFSGLRPYQGRQVHGSRFPAPLRPCAARAALREQALLLHLFRASYACAIASSALFFRLETVSRPPGAWLKVSGAIETVGRPRGASRASPLLHLFRANYVCAIASSALFFWLETVSRLPGAWLKVSGAFETVRRPRGASRAGARSHICFGPVMSAGSPCPLQISESWPSSRIHQVLRPLAP